MTLFGDLDHSVLREKPPGRQPVSTYLVSEPLRERWWEFVLRKLREGRQAYVIAPLVEESASISTGSAEALYESLSNGPLEAFRLGLIHGRMSSGEKEAAMADFRRGRTQVLISTSVIEVGVDVPNATVMTIDGAERFGLAQLHQLRGRVARGRFPGYCGVLASPRTDDAEKRLEAFARTDDGFELAEIDFQLRGPGNLLGTEQHGLASFRVADLARDGEILEEARGEALRLLEEDPRLMQPKHAPLRRKVLSRYGERLELGDAG
jgi:ATP-dependent DNA helicase RecG